MALLVLVLLQRIFLMSSLMLLLVFFLNDTAITEIYTLSLHDALPISFANTTSGARVSRRSRNFAGPKSRMRVQDRKSTRLNSSHRTSSYAVFCLKKKKK